MASPSTITPVPSSLSARSSSSASTNSSSSSVLIISETAPVGGLTITQPPQTANSFFKIASGDPITFGWNFTCLLVNPTHLTVSAICDNGNRRPGKFPLFFLFLFFIIQLTFLTTTRQRQRAYETGAQTTCIVVWAPGEYFFFFSYFSSFNQVYFFIY